MATKGTGSYTATNLKAVIKQQGRSLRWMADQCGVTRYHFSRICSGERRATVAVAHRCSDVLGVPLGLLFE